jgi:hypothetical protein
VVLNSHYIEHRDPAAIKLRSRAWRRYPTQQIEEAKRRYCQVKFVRIREGPNSSAQAALALLHAMNASRRTCRRIDRRIR